MAGTEDEELTRRIWRVSRLNLTGQLASKTTKQTCSRTTGSEMSLQLLNGLILRGERIVVHSALRQHLLEQAHESHPIIVRTKQRPREVFWWPGMDTTVEIAVQSVRSGVSAYVTLLMRLRSRATSCPAVQLVPFPEKLRWTPAGCSMRCHRATHASVSSSG